MVWIVIAFLVLAVIGPVFYLMPSKRERQLANVRMTARREGLGVDLTHIPKLDAAPEERVSAGGVERHPTIECATYRHHFASRLDAAPSWHLIRDPSSDRPIRGWRAVAQITGVDARDEAYWRAIGDIAEALPGGCLGEQATAQFVAWMGSETFRDADPDEVVAEIAKLLRRLADLHVDIDQKAQDSQPES